MEETAKEYCERLYPETTKNLKKSSMRCMKPSVRNKGIMDSGNISVGSTLETTEDKNV